VAALRDECRKLLKSTRATHRLFSGKWQPGRSGRRSRALTSHNYRELPVHVRMRKGAASTVSPAASLPKAPAAVLKTATSAKSPPSRATPVVSAAPRAALGAAKPAAASRAVAAASGKPVTSAAKGVASKPPATKKPAPAASGAPHKPSVPPPIVTAPEVPLSTDGVAVPAPPASPGANDGMVTVRFNHYKPAFPISGGRLPASAVDEELSLSFAYPGCRLVLHAGSLDGAEVRVAAAAGSKGAAPPPPPPTAISDTLWEGLVPGETYWVRVVEDAAEAAASAARQAEWAAARASERAAAPAPSASAAAGGGIVKEKLEGCSCIEGNPCMDAYGCRNWKDRYEVAKAHGWKGF
jgi:hypothetical protein